MEIVLAIFFIVLAINLLVAEYLIKTNKHKKLMSKKEGEEYMMSSLIVGQRDRAKIF